MKFLSTKHMTLKLLTLMLAFLIFSCQPSSGTSTGNPLLRVSFAGYSIMADSKLVGLTSPLAVSQVRFCFKRIRFKTFGESTNSQPELDSDNIDFQIGDVLINSGGTMLSDIGVPVGTYTRIEFDLEDKCSSNLSVDLTNNGFQYVTDQRITIKFSGTFEQTAEGGQITLNPQALLTALGTVTQDSQIKPALEGVSGTY